MILDHVTARLFPTVAKFARRQWWLGALGIVAVLCALSFAGGVMLGSYRGKTADENYYEWGRRLNILEREYERDHPKRLRTTRAQAAVLVEQAKEQP